MTAALRSVPSFVVHGSQHAAACSDPVDDDAGLASFGESHVRSREAPDPRGEARDAVAVAAELFGLALRAAGLSYQDAAEVLGTNKQRVGLKADPTRRDVPPTIVDGLRLAFEGRAKERAAAFMLFSACQQAVTRTEATPVSGVPQLSGRGMTTVASLAQLVAKLSGQGWRLESRDADALVRLGGAMVEIGMALLGTGHAERERLEKEGRR